MNKLIQSLLTFVLLCCHATTQAQFKVSGVLVDTVNFTNLGYTSVSIMRSSDSVLQDFGRANEEGKFLLNVKEKGKYFIRYVHPLFTTFVSDVDVQSEQVDLDSVYMLSLENLLAEFIVRDSRPITIKGDTIEYTADSFKVKEFASVNELLKRLPGIEVDKDGKISAHGKTVKKMLVDGDEFFSDDPAVLSKMLRASAIDKVQVFDNKSEEAKVTGIDDGEKVATINLLLKDSAKKGYFGKVEAGGGPPGFYQGQAMVNAYAKKRKFTAFAIGSNTNKVGLGWDDANNFGNSMNRSVEFTDDGSMITSYNSDGGGFEGYDGNFSGQGLPRSVNGGVHYDDKFGKDAKSSYAFDYRVNNNATKGFQNSRTQYIMPDTQYVNTSKYDFNNRNLMNNIVARTELKIDSLTTLSVRLNGSINKSNSNSQTSGAYSTMSNELINESEGSTIGESTTQKMAANINFSRKMKKEGRSFTANLTGDYSQTAGDRDFKSKSHFYKDNSELIYNQVKRDSALNTNVSARLTYSEPLIKERLFLTTNVSSSYLNNENQLSTYDKDPASMQDTFNRRYSNNTSYSVFTNSAGADLRYTNKPWNFSAGARVVSTQYANTNNFTDTTFERDYLNFFPRASVRYSKGRNTSIGMNYNGSTSQPRVDQVQVLVSNSDPLNVRIGNPDLVQEFRHSIGIDFNSYQMLSERSLYFWGNLDITQNAFSETRNISPEGVSTYQTINVDGNWRGSLYGNYSFKVKPIKTRLSLGANTSYSVTNNMLNGQMNTSTNYSIGPSLRANYYNDTGLSFSYNISPGYRSNVNTVNSNIKTNYFTARQEADVSYEFASGLMMGLEANWNYRQKMDENDKNNSVLLANAYLEKSFLKDKSLKLRAEGNDLFNRNQGLSRYNSSNYIVDSEYSTIKRYFMLVLTWNFTKTGGEQSSSESNK